MRRPEQAMFDFEKAATGWKKDPRKHEAFEDPLIAGEFVCPRTAFVFGTLIYKQ
jgi:hypothetical protein